MKKIQIMLFSIGLFAIVGVALAFKAKGSIALCISDALPQADGTCPLTDCPNPAYGTVGGSNLVCYTFQEPVGEPCPHACFNLADTYILAK